MDHKTTIHIIKHIIFVGRGGRGGGRGRGGRGGGFRGGRGGKSHHKTQTHHKYHI